MYIYIYIYRQDIPFQISLFHKFPDPSCKKGPWWPFFPGCSRATLTAWAPWWAGAWATAACASMAWTTGWGSSTRATVPGPCQAAGKLRGWWHDLMVK